MSKYRFTIAQKLAIHRVLGARCIWCTEPVAFKDCVLDHVIPESITARELTDLTQHFKLSPNFNVNSFYNWGPIHDRCNRRKSSKTFKAPFIGELLHDISNRVPEIISAHEEIERELKNSKPLAHLEHAVKNKQITKNDIDTVLGIKKKSSMAAQSPIQNFFKCNTYLVTRKGRYGNKRPRQFYDVSYEQFDTTNESLLELNCIVEAEAIRSLMTARGAYFDYLKEYSAQDLFDADSSEGFSMTFYHASKNFISYTTSVNFYHTGTAHWQYAISGHSYYLNPLRPIDLQNIILSYDDFILKITPLAYKKMIDSIRETEPDLEVTDYSPIEKTWLTREFKAFSNFHFTQNALCFIFNPYEVSAWSYGAHFPEFSFDELIKLFPEETHLLKLISSINTQSRTTKNSGNKIK